MDYFLQRAIEDIENTFVDKKVKYKRLKREVKAIIFERENVEEGIICLASVLNIAQEGVIKFIEGIVGSSLREVYGEGYGFELRFELKRNQPEIYMNIIKNGAKFEPKFDCGIGISDICSFALRLALWALYEPRTASVLIFDECFKNVHGKIANERIGLMVKKLSEELEVQIIIVSGEEGLLDFADKGFEVKSVKGRSIIEEVK